MHLNVSPRLGPLTHLVLGVCLARLPGFSTPEVWTRYVQMSEIMRVFCVYCLGPSILF
jgi:hypothetical protein